MRRLLWLVLLLFALCSVAPVPAMAEGGFALAKPPDEGNAEIGAAARLLSKNLIIESGATHVECAESELSGTIGINGPEKATVELSSSRFEGEGGKCKAGSLAVALSATGLPWTAQFNENGSLSIAGKSGVSFSAVVYLFGSPVTTCKFEATNLTGEFELGILLGAVLPGQTLKRTAGSSTFCSETATLKGEFAVEGGGGADPTYGTLPAPTTTLRETKATGVALAVNAGVSGSSANFFINNNDGSGRVDCANSSFAGKVLNNKVGIAFIEVTNPAFQGATDKWCQSTIKPGGVASRAVLTPENTPWRASFWNGASGSFYTAAQEPGFKIELYKQTDETLLLTCRYRGRWVTSFTLNAALGMAVSSPFGGLPRNDAGSDKGCSPTVALGGTFSVVTSPGKLAIVVTKP